VSVVPGAVNRRCAFFCNFCLHSVVVGLCYTEEHN